MSYLGKLLSYTYLLMLLGASCSYVDRNEAIIKKWEVKDIEIVPIEQPEDTLKPNLEEELLSNNLERQAEYQIFYEFLPNDRYRLQIGQQIDEGTWALSNDRKVLLLKSLKGVKQDNAEFWIEELNDYRLTISVTDEAKGKKEILHLEPVK